ncbi:calcium-binding protein [Oscillatoria sp. FACHB-1407]|uniref:beta strand repeat-containing protein n=1 Tax=Oscillatoria sp. FACHB-1407 TaxID=2692847 RepID=UPI00168828E6|nr:calcium-binding protein [Oscillatoria sp. FACHB-1407]MBD2463594.1 calcium-binding protein [Oscillatoria sp. FACHB-1407]
MPISLNSFTSNITPTGAGFFIPAGVLNGRFGDAFVLGDVNADGIGDLVTTIPDANITGGNFGQINVQFGPSLPASFNFSPVSPLASPIAIALADDRNASNQIVDFNGDRIPDFVIGLPLPSGTSVNGGVAIVFGNASRSGSIDALALPTSESIEFGNGGTERRTGTSVDVGDINGDGLADVIIGETDDNPTIASAFGNVIVLFGSATTASIPTSTGFITNTNQGLSFATTTGTPRFGETVRFLGDINDDTIGDFAFANPSGAGEVFVVFGKRTFAGSPTNINPSTLAAADGFTITGGTADELGTMIGRIGDVNADGIDDMLVGTTENRAFVVFGRSSTSPFPSTIPVGSINGTNGFRIDLPGSFSSLKSTNTVDYNNDGIDDIYISSETANSGTGQAFVVFGRRGASAFAATVTAANIETGNQGIVITGGVNDRIGEGTGSGSGDINNDGTPDLAIGAPSADGGSGRVYVVYGQDGALPGLTQTAPTLDAAGFGSAITVNLADARKNFTFDVVNGTRTRRVVRTLTGYTTIIGTAQNDTITGDAAANTLTGNAGNDTITGGAGTDTIVESGDVNFTLTDTALTGLGTDVLAGIEVAQLTGGAGANTFDTTAFTGNTTLNGGAGNDLFITGAGNDTIDGGDGIDTFRLSTNVTSLTVTSSGTSITLAGLGNDTLTNIEILDITGGAGANTFNAAGFAGTVNMQGGGGNDRLTGSNGNDDLRGDLGNDILTGGNGRDTLRGGAGRDQFVFDTNAPFSRTTGPDRIIDFVRGVDRIVLDRTTFNAIRRSGRVTFDFNERNVRAAQRDRDLITYVPSTGKLYYNQNGSASGFGTGGEIATLTRGTVLSAADIILRA